MTQHEKQSKDEHGHEMIKTDRNGPRICEDDDIGLNIDFSLSEYIKIWLNISKMTKIDQKISKNVYIYFLYIFLYISYAVVLSYV